MKYSKFYFVLFFVSIAFVLYSCDSVTDSSASKDLISQELILEADAKKDKIDICHYEEELDEYKLINVNGNAEQAHIDHGDFEAVDGTCQQTAIEIPPCVEGAVNAYSSNNSNIELVLEDLAPWTFSSGDYTTNLSASTIDGYQVAVIFNEGSPFIECWFFGLGGPLDGGIFNIDYNPTSLEMELNYIEYLLDL